MKHQASEGITIYACGGTGINIASRITDKTRFDITYIDTSDSNVKGVDDDSNRYIVDDMDGSGKDRKNTFIKAGHHVPIILNKYPPKNKTIVIISSLSGGTGSVLAPMIANELLSKEQGEDATDMGYSIVVIGVTTKASVRDLKNSIDTIETYVNISDVQEKPIGLFYLEDLKRDEVYRITKGFLDLLSVITDPERTNESDKADFHNFINFHTTTPIDPTLSLITYGSNLEGDGSDSHDTIVASTILVSKNEGMELTGVTPQYSTEVLVTCPDYALEDIRLDNVVGDFPVIISRLKEELQKQEDLLKTFAVKKAKVSAGATKADPMTFGGR